MNEHVKSLKKEEDPFGAKVLEGGRVRFRIWMPQQEKVVGMERRHWANLADIPEEPFEMITDEAALSDLVAQEYLSRRQEGEKVLFQRNPEKFPLAPGGLKIGLNVVIRPKDHARGNPRIWFADTDQSLEMESIGEGWFELVTDKAEHGSRYMIECWNHYYNPGWTRFPDPASRQQEENVHGVSVVVDPARLDWRDEPEDWHGVAQEDLVIYELHPGAFTPEGTLHAAIERLDDLRDLGITAIELMPLGGVGCTNNWGYDEVLKGALHTPYGTPQDMVDFVKACHRRGIAVLTDQVDNHNGSEGNYPWMHTPELWAFEDIENIEKQPLDGRKTVSGGETPWGAAFDYSRWEVRRLALQKNRGWQEVYRTDGVRRDATHAIRDPLHENDPKHPHLLEEMHRQSVDLAERSGRRFVTIIESEHNQPTQLEAGAIPENGQGIRGNATWADDFHHALRAVIFRDNPATGFMDKGYYTPYNDDPISILSEVMTRGAAFGIDTSRNAHQTTTDRTIAFDPRRHVFFTANHDTVGNTPHGERIERLLDGDSFTAEKLRLMATVLMMSPAIPLIFMGQERALRTPFPFFADWENEGMQAGTRDGRKREFVQYGADITDPCSRETVASAKFPWGKATMRSDETSQKAQAEMFWLYQQLISRRKADIAPHLASGVQRTEVKRDGDVLGVSWTFSDGHTHGLRANFSNGLDTTSELDPWSVQVNTGNGWEPACKTQKDLSPSNAATSVPLPTGP